MAVTGQKVIDKTKKNVDYGGNTFWNYYGLAKGTAWCAACV